MSNTEVTHFVKCPPTLIIFGTKMANTIKICDVHSFPPHLIGANAVPC